VLPVGAAIDSANGVLWVADQGNLCLRYITLGGGTFGPIMRAWGMGRPRGVAVDAAGTVYTADAQNLWIIAPGLAAGAAPVFTRIALPGVGPTGGIGLQGNVQSMAYSNLDNCLYFNCLAPSHVAGWLYKWTPPSAFAVVAPAADSDTTPSGAGSP
jgi:DNA-binding beta-propeller fold protein YncE